MHLIYGHRGWIGGQLTKLLDAKGERWVGGTARCDDQAAVAAELDRVWPDRVVMLIGRTHGTIDGRQYSTIDYLEQAGKNAENWRDNYLAPRTVIQECAQRGIHCTYLGTGCIFSYDKRHPCPADGLDMRERESGGMDDDDAPTFAGSRYSAAKGQLDQDLEPWLEHCLVLRLRMPITDAPEGRNFITKIVGYPKVCSIQNSMSDLPSLLPLLLAMSQARTVGRHNFTNPGTLSHNEILAQYREICEPEYSWTNWTEDEQSAVLAAGRSNTALQTNKLQRVARQLGVPLPTIDAAVERSLRGYARAVTGVRMLVTGGCGFIGSHFVNAVVRRGLVDRLVNVDALHESADLGRVAEDVSRAWRYSFVHGDVGDLEGMKRLLVDHRITHVVHFAAQSHVTRSFEESLLYTRDNVVGTHTLLEACRQYCGGNCCNGEGKIKKFVHVSTDEVYGDSELGEGAEHFTEQSVLYPTNPYAATKAGAELMARAYRESFGIPVVVTRGNNVYGPEQHEEKLVPRFLALARAGKKLTIEGDGSCVRAFMHVDDAVEAFLAVFQRGKIGEVYNIGCDEGAEISVMEVARMVVALVHGADARVEDWIEYVPDRPYNDKRYYISNAKLRGLGWVPTRTDFAAGLAAIGGDRSSAAVSEA
jgi:dTDP-glucose 4,6-dehydratase